jgi:hypothetical protein
VDDRIIPASGSIWYSAFTRQHHGNVATFSVPIHAELIEPSAMSILGQMEGTMSGAGNDGVEPACVTLLFQALPEDKAAEVLLLSAWPKVRVWALKRLGQTPKGSRSPAAEVILWQALYDPAPDLRLEAARGLLRPETPGDDLVRRMVHALGGEDIDACIQAALSLKEAGLSEELVRQTVTALEGDRPTTCPVCHLELAGRDRPEHLQDVHGYVSISGTLLPRPMALERLWDGVFLQGDIAAHDQLVEIFNTEKDCGKSYVASLEEELKRGSRIQNQPSAIGPRSSILDPRSSTGEHLLACLRQSPERDLLLGHLLHSKESPIRELAREILLPGLIERMPGKISSGDLRRHLDQACPEDLLEEKILLCLRLPRLGVDMAAANACLAQLQEERPITCDECKARVRLGDLETHLRRVHGIFEFRGVRRSFAETRSFLLEAVCGPSPDYAAWTTLEAIAGDRYSAGADARLVAWVGSKLRTLSPEQRSHGTKALAEVIAVSSFGERFVSLLAEAHKLPALQALRRNLALEIAARLPPPVSQATLEAVKPFVADKQVPREARQNAVAALLRTTGKTGQATRTLLDAFVADTGKLRAIDKLHLLEQAVGQVPEIDNLVARLEDQVRMNCPRCSIQLRRYQMVPHLWDRHRLVLEGRRVRDPWRVMEDWLEDYRLERDAAVLERCRELALKLDPDHGPRNVQRLLLRHGIEDREALAALLSQAKHKHACLCPHCYGLIPVKEPATTAPLTFSEDSMEGAGYRVELTETRLFPTLVIEGPGGEIFSGSEPGRFLTRNGALALLVGPLMLVGILLTEILTGQRLPRPLLLALAIGVGLFLGGLIFLLWPVGRNRRDRLVNWAWTMLVPQMCQKGMGKAGAEFIGGLALVSAGHGSVSKRAGALQAVRETLDAQAPKDADLVGPLAAVWSLTIQDQAIEGDDPIPLLLDQVSRCFAGKLPLSYASQLLGGLPDPADNSWWTKGHWQRLQILLCEQAFAAGIELSDLTDISRAQGFWVTFLAWKS